MHDKVLDLVEVPVVTGHAKAQELAKPVVAVHVKVPVTAATQVVVPVEHAMGRVMWLTMPAA